MYAPKLQDLPKVSRNPGPNPTKKLLNRNRREPEVKEYNSIIYYNGGNVGYNYISNRNRLELEMLKVNPTRNKKITVNPTRPEPRVTS